MTGLELPASLWAATAIPAPDTPSLSESRRAHVVVVGAGFTGLSTALHLAEAGTEVVVLEAAEPGWGASGRNGGQVIAGLRTELPELVEGFGEERATRIFEYTGGIAGFVFDLIERHGIACDARQCGWIQPAHSQGAVETLAARAVEWWSRGAPVEMLDADRTAYLLGTQWYCGGYLDKRSGALQPLSYSRGLAIAAQRHGAAIHGNSLVTGLERRDGGWRVRTNDRVVDCDRVILCTNAYTDLAGSDSLWPGLARSVVPMFSFQVATRALSDNIRKSILPEGHVAADIKRLTSYFRIDSEGRLLVGGRGGLSGSQDRASFGHVTRSLREFFPQVGSPELEYFWNGRVALTLDHVPHLHDLAPGVTAGLGYNGRGIAMGTAMGKLLAEWALGGDPDELPLPVSRLRPIPFHGFRLPAMQVAVSWKRLRDRMEHRRYRFRGIFRPSPRMPR